MDEDALHAERVGNGAGVLAAGAAEAAERVTRHVVAALDRDLLDGVGHVLDGDPEEALRDLDRTQAIGEARSHALALRVLDFTAHALAAIVPGLVVVDDLNALPRAWETGRSPILAPRRFLDLDDGSPDPLPHAWTTTTDAIAARLAVRLGARELVLLKSAPIPPGLDLEAASRLGLVDPEFPRAASGLPMVRYRNLRGEPGEGP